MARSEGWGSQPAYRDFCLRTLVSNEQLDRLEYQEGLELYDLALESLPYPDRTLKHHKGLWIKNKGKDPILAAKVIEDALTDRRAQKLTRLGRRMRHGDRPFDVPGLEGMASDAGAGPEARRLDSAEDR